MLCLSVSEKALQQRFLFFFFLLVAVFGRICKSLFGCISFMLLRTSVTVRHTGNCFCQGYYLRNVICVSMTSCALDKTVMVELSKRVKFCASTTKDIISSLPQ